MGSVKKNINMREVKINTQSHYIHNSYNNLKGMIIIILLLYNITLTLSLNETLTMKLDITSILLFLDTSKADEIVTDGESATAWTHIFCMFQGMLFSHDSAKL